MTSTPALTASFLRVGALALAAGLALGAVPLAAAAAPGAAPAPAPAAVVAAPQPPVSYEGYPFESQARVGDLTLQLNGLGKRAALGIYKPYAAALYLVHKETTGAAVLADAGPKRLQLRMLMIGPSSAFVDAFDKGIVKRVPPEQREAMKPRLDAFDDVLRSCGDLHKGDVVNLDYVPGKGTTLTMNGKVRGAPVPGADLYNAMLSIFVGERALDKPMSAGLLGGTPN
jgi:hypothetical protein